LDINGRGEFEAVENEKDLESGVPDTFVSINERVTLHERVAKCSALGREVSVQVAAIEGGARLSYCCEQPRKITDTGRAA